VDGVDGEAAGFVGGLGKGFFIEGAHGISRFLWGQYLAHLSP